MRARNQPRQVLNTFGLCILVVFDLGISCGPASERGGGKGCGGESLQTLMSPK